MRELPEVISELLPNIPDDYDGLRYSLKSIAESATYSPPEGQGMWWWQAASMLDYYVPTPTSPWQLKVVEIFNGPQTAKKTP